MSEQGVSQGHSFEEYLSKSRPSIIADDMIKPGDVLLCYHAGFDAVVWAIKKVTGSPYTHAAIYLGDSQVGDATKGYGGVKRRALKDFLKDYDHVAVFRSQYGWDQERISVLSKFVDDLTGRGTKYNLSQALLYTRIRGKHTATLTEQLEKYFEEGEEVHTDGLKNAYFCSELVVACYIKVGIIGPGATVMYRPTAFSPGELGNDVSFGHIVGYLARPGYSIPVEDPFLTRTTYSTLFG